MLCLKNNTNYTTVGILIVEVTRLHSTVVGRKINCSLEKLCFGNRDRLSLKERTHSILFEHTECIVLFLVTIRDFFLKPRGILTSCRMMYPGYTACFPKDISRLTNKPVGFSNGGKNYRIHHLAYSCDIHEVKIQSQLRF